MCVSYTTRDTVVRLRKFKSCQNHLQLHPWLPNYVLLTVRTEKSPKKLFNQLTSYARGVPKKNEFQWGNGPILNIM